MNGLMLDGNKHTPEFQIIEALKARDGAVSGENLSCKLGISRVAVWKQVRKLKSLGYRIEGSAAGYKLEPGGDFIYPWELGQYRERTVYFTETVSTMREARRLAEAGYGHGTVVIAEKQTGGRGRLKRTWISEPGGLYFTYIIKQNRPMRRAWEYGFWASLVLARLLRREYGLPAHIKWPNDILVRTGPGQYKKLIGILADMQIESEQIAYLNLGVGINVNNRPALESACSLAQVLARKVKRGPVLQQFLGRFEAGLDTLDMAGKLDEWRSYCPLFNKKIRIELPGRAFQGTALDVDAEGALLLRREDGSRERILFGDCFLI